MFKIKKVILQKIIIISFFVSLAIISDLFSSFFLPFLTIPFGGKLFKISYIILYLSGLFFNFSVGFFVCFFYSIFHLIKAFIRILLITSSIVRLSIFEFILSCFLDYLIPDLIISLSSFCCSNEKNDNQSINKNILFITAIINILRFLCFFISGYYIYAFKIDLTNISNFWSFLKIFPPQEYLFTYCFIYNLIPCLVSYIIVCFFIIYCIPQFKNIFDKYVTSY
ncbi:hypothetical protein FEF22_001545 [Texas Phoenix palm phytoplasma]|uniref:Uncharacterized protein n=1 Tax=Texas Phoenix palm phytoplasma TaxID=176709 RepID=A0ABS5BIP7_9MOLU|nr:hypothetical protein [Texas Phoenix palm phytoplasma]MBP3059461.1 hypothetical protein [Texas Phoenix palm phytoplasma]